MQQPVFGQIPGYPYPWGNPPYIHQGLQAQPYPQPHSCIIPLHTNAGMLAGAIPSGAQLTLSGVADQGYRPGVHRPYPGTFMPAPGRQLMIRAGGNLSDGAFSIEMVDLATGKRGSLNFAIPVKEVVLMTASDEPEQQKVVFSVVRRVDSGYVTQVQTVDYKNVLGSFGHAQQTPYAPGSFPLPHPVVPVADADAMTHSCVVAVGPIKENPLGHQTACMRVGLAYHQLDRGFGIERSGVFRPYRAIGLRLTSPDSRIGTAVEIVDHSTGSLHQLLFKAGVHQIYSVTAYDDQVKGSVVVTVTYDDNGAYTSEVNTLKYFAMQQFDTAPARQTMPSGMTSKNTFEQRLQALEKEVQGFNEALKELAQACNQQPPNEGESIIA